MTLPETDLFPAKLRERYEPLSALGQGGMGRVFRVRDLKMNRVAALKLLLKTGDKYIEERFLREAKIGSSIRHPNIVETYDFGFVDGQPYLVLEYVDGHSLEKGVGDLDPVSIMLDVAEALTVLHSEGTIHRDVKPANILVATDGRVMLTDFGLARIPDQTALTGTGAIVGTFAYLAPELLRGEPLSPACDWWAWGITLYELTEGTKPYQPGELVALSSVTEGPLPTLDYQDPTTRAARMIQTCLVADPQERPRSAVQVRASDLPAKPVQEAAKILASPLAKPLPKTPSSRAHLPLVVAGATAILGAGLLFSTTRSSPLETPSPPPRLSSALTVLAEATASELEGQPALSDPDPWIWAKAREAPSLIPLLDTLSGRSGSGSLSDSEFAALERIDEVITRSGGSPLLELLLATRPSTVAHPRPAQPERELFWATDLPKEASGYLGTAYQAYPKVQEDYGRIIADFEAFFAEKAVSESFPFAPETASQYLYKDRGLLEAKFAQDAQLRRRSRAWFRPITRHATSFFSAIGASLRHEPKNRLAALVLATNSLIPKQIWLSQLSVMDPTVLLGTTTPQAEVQVIRAMTLSRQREIRRMEGNFSGDLVSPIRHALSASLEALPPGALGNRVLQVGIVTAARLAAREGDTEALAPYIQHFLPRLFASRDRDRMLRVLREVLEVWSDSPEAPLFAPLQARMVLQFMGGESPLWPDEVRPDIEDRWRRRLATLSK